MSKRDKRQEAKSAKPEAPEGFIWTTLHLENGETVEALVSMADFGEKVTR